MTALFLYTLVMGRLFENLFELFQGLWDVILYVIGFFIIFFIFEFVCDLFGIREEERGVMAGGIFVVGFILLTVIYWIASILGFY